MNYYFICSLWLFSLLFLHDFLVYSFIFSFPPTSSLVFSSRFLYSLLLHVLRCFYSIYFFIIFSFHIFTDLLLSYFSVILFYVFVAPLLFSYFCLPLIVLLYFPFPSRILYFIFVFCLLVSSLIFLYLLLYSLIDRYSIYSFILLLVFCYHRCFLFQCFLLFCCI